MSKAEAQALVADGRLWFKGVWANGGESGDVRTARASLLTGLNTTFNQHGIAFRASPWQNYEHVVHVAGAPTRYADIFYQIAGQADGGIAWATTFRNWYTDNVTGLLHLPPVLQALAIITHFSETARGYESALSMLYQWIDEIIASGNPGAARGLWAQFTTRFPPTLTYAEDQRTEFA